MIEIEIDGKVVQAEKGSMVIQAADDAGIYIPRFCYHKKLSIAANCRMCLVEVENSPKPLPACATPVTQGMKVFTASDKTVAAQKSVMEFLLINHPLDCPICDQGGECELQDLSMGYGEGVSRFNQGKRAVADQDLGPLISSEMTRCIHCTRCVRFGDEVAGLRELGATGRGEDMEIGTYIQQSITSELSGNVIDLCPVGALTSKPYRFTARAWEMQQHPAIAVHDCLGSHIYVHTRGEQYSAERQVMRVVPRENEAINETWLSDRDRYSYQALNSERRLRAPHVKDETGRLAQVSWEVALNEATARLKNMIAVHGAEQVGGLISPSATLEEMYLFQKWMRGVGVQNLDHRLRQTDVSDQASLPLYPGLGFPIAELDHLEVCLLVGANVRHEQPIANYRLRKSVAAGAKIVSVQPMDYEMNFTCAESIVAAGAGFVTALAQIVKVLATMTGRTLPAAVATLVESVTPSEMAQRAAEILCETKEKKAILTGAYAAHHPNAAKVRLLTDVIAALTDARLGCLTEGANAAGAWISGVLPHRGPGGHPIAVPGLAASAMLDASLRAYVLFAVEPERDAAKAHAALQALTKADLVIVFSAFTGTQLEAYADIVLPIGALSEISGTYINAEGQWQKTTVVGGPVGEARSGWEVLQDLMEGKEGLDSITEEIEHVFEHAANPSVPLTLSGETFESEQNQALYRLADWPMYQTDMLVRNAAALQAVTASQDSSAVRVHSKLAEKMSLRHAAIIRVAQGDQSIVLKLVIDDRVPDGYVYVPAGVAETAGFGEAMGTIELSA